ncbi:MAG: hypothetical protein AB1626_00055 [Candidatus Micrarchaeota archaeon]
MLNTNSGIPYRGSPGYRIRAAARQRARPSRVAAWLEARRAQSIQQQHARFLETFGPRVEAGKPIFVPMSALHSSLVDYIHGVKQQALSSRLKTGTLGTVTPVLAAYTEDRLRKQHGEELLKTFAAKYQPHRLGLFKAGMWMKRKS